MTTQNKEIMDYYGNNTHSDELIEALAGENQTEMELDANSIIMVIGVGGAGGNALTHMQKMGITGANFVACNTDKAALKNCAVKNKIQMGPGRGAGNKPEKGRELAIGSEDKIRTLLETSGVKMLFIAAGMGGGTGTGASPVIAKIAHDLGILTVAVVTMPLRMEGPGRYEKAVKGIAELNQWVDSLLVIDNERVRQMYGKLKLTEAFGKADDVLGMATKGIAELITVEKALVRVDFADVETVMRGSGRAHMSVVKASGKNRALEVAEGALSSSLLDDNRISGAKEILLSFSVSDIELLTQDDITTAMEYIQNNASYTDEDGAQHSADIIWGASEKPELSSEELELVVVATRFADGTKLNINPVYTKPESSNPFEAKPEKEEVAKPFKPEPQKIETTRFPSPKPPVTIPVSSDRYKALKTQLTSPAFVRRNESFENENDRTVPTTLFREKQQESDPTPTGGTLTFE